MNKKLDFDVIIIGAGAAGLTAAIYLKRANLNVLILEKEMPGGQMNFSSSIENYPGFEFIDGPSLSMNMYNQALKLNVNFSFEEVMTIKNHGEYKRVKTLNKEYTSRYLIIASGRKSRKLGIEDEQKYIGKGISYCAFCDGMFFKNKNVVVIGSGNTALEESLHLTHLANKIIIINKNDSFKGEKVMIEKVMASDKIEIINNSSVTKLIGDDKKITGVEVNNETLIDIDGIFVFIGYEPSSTIFDGLNMYNKDGYILVSNKNETNVDGIYAVGDAIYKEAYQIVTATAEGAIAAMEIIKKLS